MTKTKTKMKKPLPLKHGEEECKGSPRDEMEPSCEIVTQLQKVQSEREPSSASFNHVLSVSESEDTSHLAAPLAQRIFEVELPDPVGLHLMSTVDYHRRITAVFQFSDSVLQITSSPLSNLRRCGYGLWSRCICRPTSTRVAIVDLLSGVALFFDMWVIPYILAWESEANRLPFRISLMATVVWWTLNIVVSFFTGIYIHGELVMQPEYVASHYLRQYFAVDLVMAVCDWTSLIATLLDEDDHPSFLTNFPRLLKMIRLLRVSSFLRVSKFTQKIKNHLLRLAFGRASGFTESIDFLVSTLTLLGGIVWANHLIGCIWFAIGTIEHSDTGRNWLDLETARGVSYRDSNAALQYLTSLQWSLAQMSPGAAPVGAMNSIELLFNVLCLICGFLVFGSVVSSITATMVHWRKVRTERTAVLDELDTFLAQRRVCHSVGQQAREQVQVRLRRKKQTIFMHDLSATPMLSRALFSQLHEETSRVHLLSHPLFRNVWQMQSSILKKICVKAASFKVYQPHDTVFQRAFRAEGTFQLVSGSLSYDSDHSFYFHNRSESLENLSPAGGSVGRRSQQALMDCKWLCWPCLWCHWVCTKTCKALQPTELLMLSPEGITSAVRTCKPVRGLFHSYAASFCKQLLAATELTDLNVEFTQHREIVWGMGRNHQRVISNLALEALQAQRWRFRLGTKALSTLQSEMVLGNSILVETPEGDSEVVERVVAITAVRIQRSDGRVLACLLRYSKDEGIETFCHIPGTKQRVVDESLETPQEALERLMTESLWVLKDKADLRLTGPERDDTVEKSARFSLRTHYLTNVFRTQILQSEMPRCALQVKRSQWFPYGREAHVDVQDCFVMEHDDIGRVFGWVTSEEYLKSLRTPSRRHDVQRFARRLNYGKASSGDSLFKSRSGRLSKFSPYP